MKTVIGMVIKNLTSPEPLLSFAKNARRCGHELHGFVVACSHQVSQAAVEALSSYAPVHIVRVNNAGPLDEALTRRGVDSHSREVLLHTPVLQEHGLVPYGFNRNLVVMQAILLGAQALLFVDSDVQPAVLTMNGKEEVDFVGSHIGAFERGAQFASCEYSGYNILPPMEFPGLAPLLRALQKDAMLPMLAGKGESCLTLQPGPAPAYASTGKLLGGNLGILLNAFEEKELPPFFSPWYTVDGTAYLARGEDTVLAMALKEQSVPCMTTGTYLFHDTFDNYPAVPDILRDEAVQRRLFYACMGWIGRNPLYNYLAGADIAAVRQSAEHDIATGARAIADYTGNRAFLLLPRALDESYHNLPRAIEEYRETLAAWQAFLRKGETQCAY